MAGFRDEMFQDARHLVGVLNDCDHFHLGTAFWTYEGVDFIHLS